MLRSRVISPEVCVLSTTVQLSQLFMRPDIATREVLHISMRNVNWPLSCDIWKNAGTAQPDLALSREEQKFAEDYNKWHSNFF